MYASSHFMCWRSDEQSRTHRLPVLLVLGITNTYAHVARFISYTHTLQEYGTDSLLSSAMAAWQGPSLMVYNDATFTDRDFHNLARIGQASKLDKLSTTGKSM
jgi:hypothetical protein